MQTHYNNIKKSGQFKPGWKQNAVGQSKKKANQMTVEELDYLVYLLRDVSCIKLHPHLRAKVEKKELHFDIITIMRMFRSPRLRNQIVEFAVMERDGEEDKRVLIRSTKVERVHIKGKGVLSCNLLFVISLRTNEIITAYYTHKNHLYTQVNQSRYDENLNIIGG